MKIFLSWSGPQSRAVAEALNDWLPRVIQAVRVFFSPEIEKGAKWSGELDEALEGTSFGIVCLTPQNLKSEWVHYEAGALSKLREARVWTFLLDLTPGDVGQPLGRFQHTIAEKEDVRKLVRTINNQLGSVGASSLADRLLDEIFDDSWPRLEARLEAASGMVVQAELGSPVAQDLRNERAMLEEVLELLRDQQRRISTLEVASSQRLHSPVSPTSRSRRALAAQLLSLTPGWLKRSHPNLQVAPKDTGGEVYGAVYIVWGSEVSAFTKRLASKLAAGTSFNLFHDGACSVEVLLKSPVDEMLLATIVDAEANALGVYIEDWQYFVSSSLPEIEREDSWS